MTDAVGRNAARPIDTRAIEARVKNELEADYNGGMPEREALDVANTRYDDLIAANDSAKADAGFWKAMGITAGGAVAVGGLGALVGKFGFGGRTGAGAGVGALVGATVALMGTGVVTWLGSVFDDNQQDVPDTPEFRQVDKDRAAAQRALDELPDPNRIAPGAAWMQIPREAQYQLGTDRPFAKVDDWVGEIMDAQDHDGDGSIRLNPSELQRSVVGGAFSADDARDPEHLAQARSLPLNQLEDHDTDQDGRVSDAEIRTMLATPLSITDTYGLTKPQLERFDTSRDGSLSRAELTEGIVRDAATEYHGQYFTTNPDGTVPRSIAEMEDGWRSGG